MMVPKPKKPILKKTTKKKTTEKSATEKLAKSKLKNLAEMLKDPRATAVQKRKKLSSFGAMYEKTIQKKKEAYKKLIEVAKEKPKKVVGLEEFDHNLFLDCGKDLTVYFNRLKKEITNLEGVKRTIDQAIKEQK